MSEYSVALEETRTTVRLKAKDAVSRLYGILTDKEKKAPQEARKILEHDLGDIFAKRTILEYLPEESKDKEKVEAGKQTGKSKEQVIAITAQGAAEVQHRDPNKTVDTVKKFYPDIDKEPKYFKTEDDPEFLKDRLNKALETIRDKDLIIETKDKQIGQLQDIEKKRSFSSASDLQREGEKVTLVVDTLNVDHFPSVNIGSFLSVQSSLKNRGWKRVALWVKVLE